MGNFLESCSNAHNIDYENQLELKNKITKLEDDVKKYNELYDKEKNNRINSEKEIENLKQKNNELNEKNKENEKKIMTYENQFKRTLEEKDELKIKISQVQKKRP